MWSPARSLICRWPGSRTRAPARPRACSTPPYTAIHLGIIALGTTLTAVVFFAITGGSPDSAVRDAFVTVLWWVSGLLALMWALMFRLPKHANSQDD